jgi:hypothetical protein
MVLPSLDHFLPILIVQRIGPDAVGRLSIEVVPGLFVGLKTKWELKIKQFLGKKHGKSWYNLAHRLSPAFSYDFRRMLASTVSLSFGMASRYITTDIHTNYKYRCDDLTRASRDEEGVESSLLWPMGGDVVLL